MITVKVISSDGQTAEIAEAVCKLYENSFATIGKSGGHAEITIDGASRNNVIRAVRMLQRLHNWNVQINVTEE